MTNHLPTSLSVPKATPCDFRLGDLVGDDATVDFLGDFLGENPWDDSSIGPPP